MGKSSVGQDREVKFTVKLKGLRPVVFDRYAGNAAQLTPAQKLYYMPGEKQPTICLPAENLYSFFTATNTTSAPKRLLDKRQYKDICAALGTFLDIEPADFIPFTREGKKIQFGEFIDNKDEKSGCWVMYNVARLKDGIPNPKERPVLPTPWELSLNLTLYKNPEVSASLMHTILVDGGIAIGLGTFRGRYGKFEVVEFKEVKNK